MKSNGNEELGNVDEQQEAKQQQNTHTQTMATESEKVTECMSAGWRERHKMHVL